MDVLQMTDTHSVTPLSPLSQHGRGANTMKNCMCGDKQVISHQLPSTGKTDLTCGKLTSLIAN